MLANKETVSNKDFINWKIKNGKKEKKKMERKMKRCVDE
jgi:hypothetical protein